MAELTEMLRTIDQTVASNVLTVDVEDYFQVSAFEPYIKRVQWRDFECRVVRNMNRIIELFDNAGVKATFFFLGWIAERYPSLLRQVSALGHEIASHGYSHIQVRDQDENAFEQDVDRTKKLLEDITGQTVLGYRAASFSIGADNLWAYDTLAKTGYGYSSSLYPIRHDRYGMRNAPRFPFRASVTGVPELPVATFQVSGLRLPCGGGGYFRLLPYEWTKWGIRHVNRTDRRPVIFYFHPWELDPEQPRLNGLDRLTRFRHYSNLRSTEKKLIRLLQDFQWTTVMTTFGDVIRSRS